MSDQRKAIEETRALLVATFPLAFFPKGQPKRPLKIGIRDDIIAALPAVSKNKIHLAMSDYCFGPTYWEGHCAGRARVDLSGADAGVVTDEQAAHAARRALGLRSQFKLETNVKVLRVAAGLIIDVFSCTPDDVIRASLGTDVLAAVQATRDAHARAVAP